MSNDRSSRGAVTSQRGSGAGSLSTARERFAAFRRSRPFWGSTLAILAGLEIYSAAAAPMRVVVMQGLPGLLTIVVALVAVIMGAVTLRQPEQRVITGWIVLVLGPLSILATNLGGFVIGMILLVVGGSLILSWQPLPAEEPVAEQPFAGEPVAAQADSDSYSSVEAPTRAEPADDHQPYEAPATDAGYAPTTSYEAVAYAAPAASDSTTSTGLRNPWRSRLPETSADEPEPAGATAEQTTPVDGIGDDPTSASSTPVATAPEEESVEHDETAAGEAVESSADSTAPAAGRSWFDGKSAMPPIEPPKLNVRTTLLIPVMIMAMLATGFLASPAKAATAPQAGLFDWLLNPAPKATPTPTPTVTPTPSPSATSLLPGIKLPQLPKLPGSTTPSTGTTSNAATAADCAKAASLTGTTTGGTAAVNGAAAVKSCQAAGQTATVSKAAAAAPTPQLSADLSTLKASRLEMSGFKYNGVVSLNTPNGPLKVLSFSLDTLKVTGMNQTYPFGNGGNQVAITNSASVVTISGNVHLYVTSMTGAIYGLLTLTFTPNFAPPLVLPSMFFTNTTSKVALVQADKITLPNLVMPIS